MIDHALRYCRDCKINTCCQKRGRAAWKCQKCEGTSTEAFHVTRQYLNAIKKNERRLTGVLNNNLSLILTPYGVAPTTTANCQVRSPPTFGGLLRFS